MSDFDDLMNPVVKLDTVIDFGKWKGTTIERLIIDDPKYLLWAEGNELLRFSRSLRSEIEEAVNEYGPDDGDQHF